VIYDAINQWDGRNRVGRTVIGSREWADHVSMAWRRIYGTIGFECPEIRKNLNANHKKHTMPEYTSIIRPFCNLRYFLPFLKS
jgi:hypothetical protein